MDSPVTNPLIPPALADCTWKFVLGTTVTLTSGGPPTWGGACSGVVGRTCMVTVDANIDVDAAYA
jgi:hypothetical protein